MSGALSIVCGSCAISPGRALARAANALGLEPVALGALLQELVGDVGSSLVLLGEEALAARLVAPVALRLAVVPARGRRAERGPRPRGPRSARCPWLRPRPRRLRRHRCGLWSPASSTCCLALSRSSSACSWPLLLGGLLARSRPLPARPPCRARAPPGRSPSRLSLTSSASGTELLVLDPGGRDEHAGQEADGDRAEGQPERVLLGDADGRAAPALTSLLSASRRHAADLAATLSLPVIFSCRAS